MKVKNLLFSLSVLVVSLTLVLFAYPQKPKKNRSSRKTTVQRTLVLTEKQNGYLKKLIEKLESADGNYYSYTQGLPAYDFFETVSEMVRTDDMDGLELPEPIQSQTSYVIRSYKGWKELLYLMIEGRKSLDYIQYQTQLNSILERYNLDGMSETSALARLKSLAQNSKNKLELMISMPSKRISADKVQDKFSDGIIFMSENPDKNSVKPNKTSSNPDVLVGTWKGSSKLTTSELLNFELTIIKEDDSYHGYVFINDDCLSFSGILVGDNSFNSPYAAN